MIAYVDTWGKYGPQHLQVALNWECSNPHVTSLTKVDMILDAVRAFEIDPQLIDFGHVDVNQSTRELHAEIKQGNQKLNWDSIVTTAGKVNVAVKNAAPDVFDLNVMLDPAKLPLGIFKDSLKLKLYCQGKEVAGPYEIPVKATLISSALSVIPDSIYLGIIPAGSSAEGEVNIHQLQNRKIKLLSVLSSSTFLRATSTATDSDNLCLKYHVEAGKETGNQSGILSFKVLSDKEQEITVPWIAYVK